jgi:hypothetical protein
VHLLWCFLQDKITFGARHQGGHKITNKNKIHTSNQRLILISSFLFLLLKKTKNNKRRRKGDGTIYALRPIKFMAEGGVNPRTVVRTSKSIGRDDTAHYCLGRMGKMHFRLQGRPGRGALAGDTQRPPSLGTSTKSPLPSSSHRPLISKASGPQNNCYPSGRTYVVRTCNPQLRIGFLNFLRQLITKSAIVSYPSSVIFDQNFPISSLFTKTSLNRRKIIKIRISLGYVSQIKQNN